MNKKRREQILSTKQEIENQLGILQGLQEEEQEYYDEIPENLQESERAINAEEAAEEIQNMIDEIEQSLEWVDNIIYK